MADNNLYMQLLQKSQEAFIMAIEIYNKPTLKYRVEGFAFFICNAWELMLKALILKRDGEKALYYHDKENRTISLRDCVGKIFTNENDPLRKNLECIIDLRNTGTHYITTEYEFIYAPLFQSCVKNYTDKLLQFHDMDITKMVSSHFIQLSVSTLTESPEEIIAKYGDHIGGRFNEYSNKINTMIDTESSTVFAVPIIHYYHITKDRNNPDSSPVHVVGKDMDATNIRIVKQPMDITNSYPFTVKTIIFEVNKRFERLGITSKFNSSTFKDLCQKFNWKQEPRLAYLHVLGNQAQYTYSQQVIDLIVMEFTKDSEFGNKIHAEMEARRKEAKKNKKN